MLNIVAVSVLMPASCLAGSMDIEDGLDRNAQESAEDFKCGTESQANSVSKAIAGFSMAILAGLPA